MLFLFMLLVSVVGFCCWMFRGMGVGIVCKLCECVFPNLSKTVINIVSWRGLGEVLGAVGAPLGTQGGPTSGC